MNKAMLTVGLILLSAIALYLINMVSNYSTGSELDYYLLKETTTAAMTDAVDEAYYKENGLLRMDKEKFAESFLLRFADGINVNPRQYKIGFYDINETPPKVSVKVESSTTLSYKGTPIKIATSIDAILENKYTENKYIEDALNGKNKNISDIGTPISENGVRNYK